MPTKKNEYSQVRSDHATEIAEDYVEAIAELIETHGSCRAVHLASRFDVTPVTVNRTIARLVRDGWVETEPYGPVELTAAGRRLAEKAKYRHEIVYNFLLSIGVTDGVARVDSEGIEHHVSPETMEAMKQFIQSNRG